MHIPILLSANALVDFEAKVSVIDTNTKLIIKRQIESQRNQKRLRFNHG